MPAAQENDAGASTSLARYIQHTKIEAAATADDMRRHIEECLTYGFDAAMVPGSWVPLAVEVLRGTAVEIASALDFPTVGVMTSAGKAAEAAELVRLGATQIDMGVQIGWLKSGRYDDFRKDIRAVVAAGVPVKVMLELPLLTPTERDRAIELAVEAGARYLKNASGGHIEQATPESVRYLAERAPQGVLIKASGSITSATQTRALLDAGAELVGTSAGLAIVQGDEGSNVTSY